MIFIYHLEDHPRYAPLTQQVFDAWEDGRARGCVSAVVLLELLVRPLSQGKSRVADDYRELLETFPHLRIEPVTAAVAYHAARLRAAHRIGTADAIITATALEAGATGLLTNDRTLSRVNEIDIFILDEAAELAPAD